MVLGVWEAAFPWSPYLLYGGSALAREPHRIAFFLNDLAAEFHGLWNRGNEQPGLRFLLPEDPQTTAARMLLVRAVRQVVASGLAIIGVTPAEEMR